jgi:hypothetical protein
MAMTPEEKADRERDRLIAKAKEFSAGTYCRKFVAPLFQRMIRAEDAAAGGTHRAAVVDGVLKGISRRTGQCVCCTCGKVDSWDSGIKGMHTGHFLASRRNSILLLEENCAPQCASCNFYRDGAPSEFRLWMETIRGIEVIERIQNLKRMSVSFHRDDLVDMRIEFNKRLQFAIDSMKGRTQ